MVKCSPALSSWSRGRSIAEWSHLKSSLPPELHTYLRGKYKGRARSEWPTARAEYLDTKFHCERRKGEGDEGRARHLHGDV